MVQAGKCDASPCFGSSSRSGKINCVRCQKSFHLKCAGLTTTQYKFVRECPGAVWLCLICRNTPDMDLSAANFSFNLILDRISSVIRLVGRQIDVTRTLCRTFGQDQIRPSCLPHPVSSGSVDVDHSRNFENELDNLQLDFTNEFNSLVDVVESNFVNNENRSSSPSTFLSSSKSGQEGDVAVSVENAAAPAAIVQTGVSSCTSSVPSTATHSATSSSAGNTFCPGNLTRVICPTEASSDTAAASNFHHVADSTPALVSGLIQSKKDAATQFHLPSVSANINRSVSTLPSVPVTRRDAATQSLQSGNIGPGICPAEADNDIAPSHQASNPIPVSTAGNDATAQQPIKNRTRKSSTKPPSVPFTSTSMPYWYMPPPPPSMLYPSYLGPHAPQQFVLPSYNIPGHAAISANSYNSTSNVEPPTVSRQASLQRAPNTNTMSTLNPPANAGNRKQTPITQHANNESLERFKQFYVTPFEPSTTADQISNYISSRTGWTKASFRCQLLTSAARKGRPLSFVSFKVLILDNPLFTNTITKNGFWPSFVNVTPFEPRPRK